MLEVFIGLVSGLFSGIGMGGGTILIFMLTNLTEIDQHQAQAVNLIFFIPTAISSILINNKEKNVDIKLALIISIIGSIGVIIGVLFAVNLDVRKLQKYFGIFLAIIAIHEIYTLFKEYKESKKRDNKSSIFKN